MADPDITPQDRADAEALLGLFDNEPCPEPSCLCRCGHGHPCGCDCEEN